MIPERAIGPRNVYNSSIIVIYVVTYTLQYFLICLYYEAYALRNSNDTSCTVKSSDHVHTDSRNDLSRYQSYDPAVARIIGTGDSIHNRLKAGFMTT